MKLRLLTFLAFAIGGIGFEYDPGSGNDGNVSRYQFTRIVVSDGKEPYRIELQYVHTFTTSFSLSIRITNDKYSNALLYTQSFSSSRTITRSIEVPSSMVHQPTQWKFFSQSTLGTKQWTLKSQPREKEMLNGSSFSTWESTSFRQEINGAGTVVTKKESLVFQAFQPIRVEPYYGRLSLTHLGMRWVSRPEVWIDSINAYLLIAKDTYFEELLIWDDTWYYLPLEVYLDGQTIRFRFPTLYVHPARLTMSQVPLQGYVPTSHFYFPLHQFHRFRDTTFQLHFSLNHITDLTLSYNFLYHAEYPLLGPCSISQFCVRVPYA